MLFVSLISALTCGAQTEITGVIVNEKTKAPLPFVNVVVKETRQGVASDIEGRFRVRCQTGQTLQFLYVGFQSKSIVVDGTRQKVTVTLVESTTELGEVVVRAGENPALKIIRKAIANREKHDPQNLPSYSYHSYNKLSCAIQAVGSLSKYKRDTMKLKDFIENKLVFVSESYTEKKYVKPDFHKEVVLGNRFSGIEDPFFAFLATDFQPFGFYDDQIALLGKKYLNPLQNSAPSRYDYVLEDTIYQGVDSIFVVSFEPLPGKAFEGLKGQLYITSDGYALTHVLASPADKHQLMEAKVQQYYEKQHGHWFPSVLNSELVFNSYDLGNIRPYYYSRSYLSDIIIGDTTTRKTFELLDVSFAEGANHRKEDFWQENRLDSLSKKEVNTYKMYDSLKGRLRTLNTMMKLAEAIMVGRFKVGSFYLPTEQLFRFNQYEGVRMGLGLQTGESLSKVFSLDGYGAYGFNDKAFKYGGGLKLNLVPGREGYLRMAWQQDVSEPGNPSFIRSPAISGSETFRRWLTARMDSVQIARIEFAIRPLPHAQVQIFVDEQRRNPAYNYVFQPSSDTSLARSQFTAASVGFQWRYAFRERYTQIGNSKIVTESANPQIQIAVSKSISGMFAGQYDFLKVEARFDHQVEWARGGKTIYQVAGGYAKGTLPYPFLFNAKATLYPGTLSQGIYIQNYFQTMNLYEFVSDQYLYVFLQHNFGRLTGTRSKIFRPELSLIQNTGWGSLRNPSYHQGVTFNTLEKGYFESGLMLTNIVRLEYAKLLYYGIGAGAFYRYGPYALPSVSDNLAWKIFVSVTF